MAKPSYRSIYNSTLKLLCFNRDLNIQNGFVFRMGELHVVFCALKVIGKLIDGSGLDQIFDEAGMSSLPNNLRYWSVNINC